ncbi:MAG TPA: hypothetical protein VHK90_05210 [Thermoanaerobaculia bacterium]|nr:hypothetical protein [Thermoanaerobaculia bacterium]
MYDVTVYFIGICTHISRTTLADLPAKQRVVLVNARHGKEVKSLVITPHAPLLTLPDQTLRLDGATMSLQTANQSTLALQYDDTFANVPNLTMLMQGVATLGPPSRAVVLERDPLHAAGYFDIDFGTLSAAQDGNGAAVVSLQATSSDPIYLVNQPWDGPAETLAIPSGSILMVANVDEDPQRDLSHPAIDFLLHYVTAETMPAIPQVPQTIDLPQTVTHPFFTVGAGCSNSNYP